jgi:hypothetical protein
MLKQILILTMIFVSFCSLLADTGKEKEELPPVYGWQNKAVGKLNLTQNSYSNWSQGGENLWSWQLGLDANFINVREKYQLEFSGKFAFGKSKVVGKEPRKSEDELRLETILTFNTGEHLDVFISALIQTQFAPGYKYDKTSVPKVSDFLDPIYFTQSIGFEYNPGWKTIFKTRLGAAVKETFARTHLVPYADDPNTPEFETSKVEVGMDSTTDMEFQINSIISFKTKLQLFSNFRGVKYIDVYWDSSFTAEIAKHVHAGLNVKLLYEREVSPRRQLKQTLTVGLSYSFFQKKSPPKQLP